MAVVSLFVLLLIQVIAVTLEYELRCPVAGEWRLRPRKLLCGATQYVCLLYLPDNTHKETCDGLDYSSTGSKLVFQPNFNKARCNYNRYQPFPFSTDGSSACVYKKSFCNAEGQFPFNKGSFENDTRCGCNVSKGYTFVTKPRNKCYCIPLEEDCSCYKPTCSNKGNDCTSKEAVIMNATCSMLPENNKSISSVDEKIHKRKHIVDYDGERRGRKYRLSCVYFTVAVLIMIILSGLYADQSTITVTTNAENIAPDYGKSITLTCDVSVICTCFVKSIEWYKGKNKIKCCPDNTTKYESDRKHLELTIKDVDKNDLGDYTCVLNTIFSTYKSKDIEVVYKYALPKIVITTQLIEIQQNGESIDLSCNISPRHKTTFVKWFNGSNEIIEDRKKYELKGKNHNILSIHDVKDSDSGTYKCRVVNEKESNESEEITVVYALPVISVEKQLIAMPTNGQSINLSCYISSRYKLTSIKWFKGSDEIIENRKKYELKGKKQNILCIHDVKENDSGTYKCRVDNEKGFNESEEITVKYSLPKITVAKKQVEILKNGESIELSCFIAPEYTPTSIKWFKGADELSNDGIKYKSENNNPNILNIHYVKKSDSGTYTCKVDTGKGRNESEGITVIYSLPVLNVKEKKIEISENKKSIQLSCEVCSESELISVKWFKGFDEITGNNRNKQKYEMKGNTPNILIIYDVRADDTGTYKCRVENKKGYSESEDITVVYNVQSITNSEKNGYLKKINSGKEARQYVRIQVIGKEGVGKSSLVHRLLGKQIEGIKSTDGIEIFKYIQIRKDDGKWIVDEVETERQKRIRRIMKIVDINEKPTEISSDTQNTSEPTSNVDKSLLVTIKPDKKKSDVNEHETLNSLEITDEMTAKVFENMDEILLEVKKGKEELKSGRVVECGIWDFSGHKDYYVTHQTFLTSGAIYLLVANLKEDIKAIRYDENCDSIGEYIDFWFDSIHSFCKNPDARMLNPPVIMVCTHTDEYEKLDERISEYAKQFDCIIGQNTKANHKRNIHYISNTHENGEIDELKKTISKIAEDMSYFQVELPTHWIQLENALDFLTSDLKKNILSWTNILELGNKMLIKREGELLEFLNYQHQIGNIIFFNDIREYIVLQPNWLVKCFRCLVCDDDPTKRNPKISSTEWKALTETGRLSDTIIDDLFQKENVLEKEQKAYVLSVMEKFDIIVKPQCVGTKGDEISKLYYIPCMIRNRSISVDDLKKEFEVDKEGITISPWFILEFTFLPFAYFNHILVSYIKEFTVCGKEDEEKAIYEGKAVIFLDERKSRKLIICYSKNAISLQVWKWDQISDDLYQNVLEKLHSKIEELENKLGLTSYTVAAKCNDGNYFKKEYRISFEERNKSYFEDGTYFCEDHVNVKFHNINDIENMWFRHVDTIFKMKEKVLHEIHPTYTISAHEMEILLAVSTSVGIFHGHKSNGTCWRVGEDKIITAAHVVKDNLWNIEHETMIEDYLNKCFVDFDYVDKTERSSNVESDFVFKIEPQVVYMNECLDVAVLKLKREKYKKFPPPLELFESLDPEKDDDKFIYLIGNNKSDKKKFNFFPSGLWNPTETKMKDMEKFYKDYGKPNGYIGLDRKDRLVIKGESVNGASGCPGVVIYKDKAYVVLVYVRGFPDFYYSTQFPERKREEFPKKRLFQQGVNIGSVFHTMTENGVNFGLRNEIFPHQVQQAGGQDQCAIGSASSYQNEKNLKGQETEKKSGKETTCTEVHSETAILDSAKYDRQPSYALAIDNRVDIDYPHMKPHGDDTDIALQHGHSQNIALPRNDQNYTQETNLDVNKDSQSRMANNSSEIPDMSQGEKPEP